LSFKANWRRRWPLALVIVPKVPTEVTVVFGLAIIRDLNMGSPLIS